MPDEKDLAQANLEHCPVKVDKPYRHYKGGLYVVVAVSLHEETLQAMVTYHSNLKDSYWTRSLANFLELVTLPDGSVVNRFTREDR